MSKPKAQVRRAKYVPREYRDPTRDYQKEAETLIWTDENGRPISRIDLINYDTSDRTIFEPTPNSQFNQPQVNHYDEAFINQEKRKQKAIQERQATRDAVSSALDFVPIVGDVKGGYEDIVQPLQQGDYMQAGIGAGLMLVPNIIEKPLKYVSKFGKDVISKMLKNFNEYKLKNILETEYKKEAQRLINTIPESFKGSPKFEKNSGLVVRGQRSTNEGMFIGEGRGSMLKDGKIIPGQSGLQGQRNFSWWNENEAFSPGFKLRKPMDTFIIMDKTDIPGLEYVRNMNEHVGQWRPGSKAFVRKSEMVTPEIVNINRGRIYHLDPFEFSLGNTIYTENKLMNSTSELFPIRSYTDYRLGYMTKGDLKNTVKTGNKHYKEDITDPNNIPPLKLEDDIKITNTYNQKKIKEITNKNTYPIGNYVNNFYPEEYIITHWGKLGHVVGQRIDTSLNPSRIIQSVKKDQLFDNKHKFMSIDPKQYMWTDQHLIPITLWHKLGGKLRNNKFGGDGSGKTI